MPFEIPAPKNDCSKKSRYVDHAYSSLSPEVLDNFMQESEPLLGIRRLKGGKDTSVLISSTHALDLIEDTSQKVTPEDINRMNQESGNIKKRYSLSSDSTLLIGKQFINAAHRERGGYKADTGAAATGIELLHLIEQSDPDKMPSYIEYKFPQTHAEPNKEDANNPNMPVIDLEIFKNVGAKKLVEYILQNGVGAISSIDVMDIHKGDYLSSENDTPEKAAALTECSAIRKKMQGNEAPFKKELSATLRILGVHRKYFEEQERLLYEKSKSLYPVNIDIHTCYDIKKTKQGADMVIGSTFGESVHSIEVEYLLAAILKKHGFKVVLSTLNSFPHSSDHNLDALRSTIDKTRNITGLLSPEKDHEIDDVKNINRDKLEQKAIMIFEKRLNNALEDTNIADGILDTLCNRSNIPPEIIALSDKKQAMLDYEKDLLEKLSDDNLQLFTQQNIISEAMNNEVHYDNPVQGLWGLSSLASKYNAREKYITPERQEIRPSIIQLETVTMIMKDPKKRASMEHALQDFIEIVQRDDFDPREELRKALAN